MRKGAGDVAVDVERTTAMLALTAIHDVMKVEALLPAVAAKHAPYHGFKAGDLMLRASSMVKSDADFERYNAAMDKWTEKADAGNVMAYVSSWGEANPGGGQDEIARYLEKSRKEVVQSANLLKTIMDILGIPKIV